MSNSGTDWFWIHVTPTRLHLTRNESTDRDQCDGFPTVRTVGRHTRHLPLTGVDFKPHPTLFKWECVILVTCRLPDLNRGQLDLQSSALPV